MYLFHIKDKIFVLWLIFCDLSQAPVERFYGIGGVNQSSYFRRITPETREKFPVFKPTAENIFIFLSHLSAKASRFSIPASAIGAV
jgi:hypothetical protein